MMNSVTLIGHVGQDPEIRETTKNVRIAHISLATSERWKDKKTGERRERTEWHRVVVFGEPLANVVANYVRKGSKIYLEGVLRTREWQDKTGARRWTTEVVLQGLSSKIVLLDKAESNRPPDASDPNDYGSGDHREYAEPMDGMAA